MRPYEFRDGGMGTSAKTQGNQTTYRESDQLIVPKKPSNAGGGKGLTKRRPRWSKPKQTRAGQLWRMESKRIRCGLYKSAN
jgi:hypothetical protein